MHDNAGPYSGAGPYIVLPIGSTSHVIGHERILATPTLE